MPEKEPRRRRQRKPRELVVIPSGDLPREQFERQLSIARAIGIDLLKLFDSGAYKSPQELKGEMEQGLDKYKLEEIDFNLVGSYLLGVLDERDHDSPLRTRSGDKYSLDFQKEENISRQALTTLAALVENFGIDKVRK